MEIFDEKQCEEIHFASNILGYFFNYKNRFGVIEKLYLAVHYTTQFDIVLDSQYIIENILKPTSDFYCKYADWEDGNIILQDMSELN